MSESPFSDTNRHDNRTIIEGTGPMVCIDCTATTVGLNDFLTVPASYKEPEEKKEQVFEKWPNGKPRKNWEKGMI